MDNFRRQWAWRFDLVAFVAIVVTAIIMISVSDLGATMVTATTEMVAAYCAIRVARVRRPGDAVDRIRIGE